MAKIGRNDPCACGSGRKFKRCCEGKTADQRSGRVLMIVVGGLIVAAVAAGIASFDTERRSTGVQVWDPVHGHYHTMGVDD
jgi:hypothetical protein